jgi:hypothetical protein
MRRFSGWRTERSAPHTSGSSRANGGPSSDGCDRPSPRRSYWHASRSQGPDKGAITWIEGVCPARIQPERLPCKRSRPGTSGADYVVAREVSGVVERACRGLAACSPQRTTGSLGQGSG